MQGLWLPLRASPLQKGGPQTPTRAEILRPKPWNCRNLQARQLQTELTICKFGHGSFKDCFLVEEDAVRFEKESL